MSDDLTRAIAEVRLRQYDSEYSSDHLTWEDFTDEADEIAAAVAPLIEARVREARADELVRLVTKAKAWHTAQDLCALAIHRAEEVRRG